MALAEEIERAKGAEKANSDAIQEEVTRATTMKMNLRVVLIHPLTTVDAKEKGLSDIRCTWQWCYICFFVDTENTVTERKSLIMRS